MLSYFCFESAKVDAVFKTVPHFLHFNFEQLLLYTSVKNMNLIASSESRAGADWSWLLSNIKMQNCALVSFLNVVYRFTVLCCCSLILHSFRHSACYLHGWMGIKNQLLACFLDRAPCPCTQSRHTRSHPPGGRLEHGSNSPGQQTWRFSSPWSGPTS